MVSAVLKARITSAVAELSYQPNIAARMLAQRRSWTIAAIVPSIRNSLFARGLEAIQARLETSGYTLLLGATSFQPEREREVTEAFLARGVDGLIYMGASHLGATYAALARAQVPFVNQGEYDADAPYPSVGYDSHEAAGLAVHHLIALGHRRIGLVAGNSFGNDRASGRISGVKEALAGAGDGGWTVPVSEQPNTVSGGRAGFRALFASPRPPTAIICDNDIQAYGVLLEARDRGLCAGTGISIIGFDDLELSEQIGLSSIHVPTGEMGRLAAEYVLSRLAGGIPPHATRVEIRLVARTSTGPPVAERPAEKAQAEAGIDSVP